MRHSRQRTQWGGEWRTEGERKHFLHSASCNKIQAGARRDKKKVEALKKSQMWNSEGENNNIFAGGDQGEE